MDADETDDICRHPLKPRNIPPQNIVTRLINRETYGCRKPGTHFHVAREFYQNIFPNFTIVNIEKPPCFLRKFSPDGKYLIAFSSDQTSLEIYLYLGCSAAADLVHGLRGEYIGIKNDRHSNQIRVQVFERFFKLKCAVNVAQSGEQLNRECSLFTDDGKYVIVGSAAYLPDDHRPRFHSVYSNNEAVTPNYRSPLEDYSLHLIDLEKGRLCDTRTFKVDKIFLSHNQGLYLYKDTLAVLSVQHQTIHIFQLLDGMFVNIRTIGRFCYEDDEYLISAVGSQGNTTGTQSQRAFRETTINSLKHRLLVFLYRRAARIRESTGNPYELRKFYQLLASCLGEPDLIPFGFAPAFSHMGIVQYNATGQCVFLGFSCFSCLSILALLHTHLISPPSALKNSVLRAVQISSLPDIARCSQFRALRMWKMQLLDEDHLLVKFASEEVVTLKASEPNSQSSFFMVYNISGAEVLAIYENTSEDMLELFENFCDLFRNAKPHSEYQFTCSPSNNIYASATIPPAAVNRVESPPPPTRLLYLPGHNRHPNDEIYFHPMSHQDHARDLGLVQQCATGCRHKYDA
ncbi:hypothetical protein PR048_003361 [Dryococelus australis]|uniref:DET1 homolog n=1 Tax=Dryococelus australis TaxID=614101 RepID=A0ABQ9IMX3_9NEOP|nr:hypothetical protein PR048_003361 [Dryococelus australis]